MVDCEKIYMNKILSNDINPFTLIYLIQDDQVLLMKRHASKKLLGSKLLGLGGKVEKNEDLLTSAKREFFEETGLKLKDPILKGTYTWIDNDFIGISHLIVASKYDGELKAESEEGTLAWYEIDKLYDLKDLAEYQKNFLPQILQSENYLYTGIGIFDNDKLVSYTDTKSYFQKSKL